MKLIRGIIRQSKFDDVQSALCTANVNTFTLSEVHDFAPQNRNVYTWRGREYTRDDVIRVEITLIVDDDEADTVVATILRAARTNELADGYVAVMPVDHHYTIHTGHREIP
jgi:nitrogen regulatory protein P-II 1